MSYNRLKQCLIFGDGTKPPDYAQIEDLNLDEFDHNGDFIPSEEKQTPSAYVQVFESMSTYLFEKELMRNVVSYGPNYSEVRVRSTFFGRN
jgi:hypothetical protein